MVHNEEYEYPLGGVYKKHAPKPTHELVTISGLPPLTIRNAKPNRPESITIHGNTVDGAGVGDKTANLLQIIPYFPKTINGVTFTLEGGKIICNGTATADVSLGIGYTDLTANIRYYAKGCPRGGSTSTYRVFFDYLGGDTGTGAAAFAPSNSRSSAKIQVYSGYTCNNLIFMPIITTGGYSDFEPYGYKIPVCFASEDPNIYTLYDLYLNNPLNSSDSFTVESDQLPELYSGVNIISVNTSVQPGCIDIKYYKKAHTEMIIPLTGPYN